MTQQFYIAVKGQQTGPFSYEEMKANNIQRDTLIWTEGLDNWTKAEHVALLKDILRATPPPIPNMESKTSSQQVPPPPIPEVQPTGKHFGYELAKRRERFFAELSQVIIIGVPVILIMGPNDLVAHGFGEDLILGIMFGVIFGVINLFIYPMWSGNLGHKIMGLKVVSASDGSDYNKAVNGFSREFLKKVFSVVFIPNLWLLWDDNRQNLYDKVVKTYVVKKK